MSITLSQEMMGTLQDCLRELIPALGHRDFEVTGDEIIVRDKDKQFVISLNYEGERHLGSLDLPMTSMEYKCTGCTEAELKEFRDDISKHLMEHSGG